MMHSVLFSAIVPPARTGSPRDFSRSPAPPGSSGASTSSVILRDKRVVIVEDEGLTLMQLKKICLLAGMQVVGAATDGEQGVQKALETQPDMILMDINMPVLDGFGASERILKEINVCIVVLTAYDLEDYKERARELGTCGYVVKPVNALSLVPRLEYAFTEFHRKPE